MLPESYISYIYTYIRTHFTRLKSSTIPYYAFASRMCVLSGFLVVSCDRLTEGPLEISLAAFSVSREISWTYSEVGY